MSFLTYVYWANTTNSYSRNILVSCSWAKVHLWNGVCVISVQLKQTLHIIFMSISSFLIKSLCGLCSTKIVNKWAGSVIVFWRPLEKLEGTWPYNASPSRPSQPRPMSIALARCCLKSLQGGELRMGSHNPVSSSFLHELQCKLKMITPWEIKKLWTKKSPR